jgi:hypothetical protein
MDWATAIWKKEGIVSMRNFRVAMRLASVAKARMPTYPVLGEGSAVLAISQLRGESDELDLPLGASATTPMRRNTELCTAHTRA